MQLWVQNKLWTWVWSGWTIDEDVVALQSGRLEGSLVFQSRSVQYATFVSTLCVSLNVVAYSACSQKSVEKSIEEGDFYE